MPEGETLLSLSGQEVPAETSSGWRIMAQSYFHYSDNTFEVSIDNKKYNYNSYFILDNIQASFGDMDKFYKIFNINFDDAYKKLSEHVTKNGFNPILIGKDFSPRIINKNVSGSSDIDPRHFEYDKKYTDFKTKDFVVLDKKVIDKKSRLFQINSMYKEV